MFNPIIASNTIKQEYIDYLTTDFRFRDPVLQEQFINSLKENISKGPFLEISDIFETGKAINGLIDEGVLSPLFRKLEEGKQNPTLPLDRELYVHQVNAITQIVNGENVVVSTGTGSGKTNCFVIPVLNELLREIEKSGEDKLGPGVRALFIFPMNALANDQIKNIRHLLMNYDKITFGVYSGATEESEQKAKEVYEATYMNEDDPVLRKRLKNELISREEMKAAPPNILFTNYAMLEYLLLRPNDDILFSQADFKFVVLDEAHVYTGATGIETSMLLRRLKARIRTTTKTQFILTSATLGGSDEDVVEFAKKISGEEFKTNNIVRGVRRKTNLASLNPISCSNELLIDLADEKKDIGDVLDKYQISYDKSKLEKPEEIIYDLILHSVQYFKLRAYTDNYSNPELSEGVFELSAIRNKVGLTDDALVAFISLCSKARKEGKNLIEARYHFFVRTLEGCYISLEDNPTLSLVPLEYKNRGTKDERRLFEVSICDDCGEIVLVGKTKDGRLVTARKIDDNPEYYYIKDYITDEIEDEDDAAEIVQNGKSNKKSSEYVLCPRCGAISPKEFENQQPDECECEGATPITVIRANVTDNGDVRCLHCHTGRHRRLYLGNDGPTAVLATSLFEALPTKTYKKKKADLSVNPFFGTATETAYEEETSCGQFLTFSDSRQEAAKFSCYLDQSHKEFLRRRAIVHVLKEHDPCEVLTIQDYVGFLKNYFDTTECFKDDAARPSELTPNLSHAWIAMLNELYRYRSKNSLTALGFLQFKYLGNNLSEENLENLSKEYNNVPIKNIKELLDMLFLEIVRSGAISTPNDDDLSDENRSYIFYSKQQRYLTKEYDSSNTQAISWMPRKKSNGSYYHTNKIYYVKKALHLSDDQKAADFLEMYWDYFLTDPNNKYHLELKGTKGYVLPARYIQVMLPNDLNAHWYKCSKCGHISTNLIDGRCIVPNCETDISDSINPAILNQNNRFADLYSSENMVPLVVKEHTAQLDRVQALKYQEDFIKKKINVLSCSTTFEMGVDIGDLEAVFLRDMPPTASNYSQRAGRVGRSIDAAAYVLSFAKLSSHDFYFFDQPETMIAGEILPPFFRLDNKKIADRHIYATVLSSFFAKYPEQYNKNDADLFLNGDDNGVKGYKLLCDWIDDKNTRATLTALLRKSIPDVDGKFHKELGIDDYSWKEDFVGKDGLLTRLLGEYETNVKDFDNTIKKISEELQYSTSRDSQALEEERHKYENYKHRYMKNDLIPFLTRGNILPRYGFPVDTVELEQYNETKSSGKLNLNRDLQMAIAEYAPSSEVVADGLLYTSRYIKKSMQDQKYGWKIEYLATCTNPECKSMLYSSVKPRDLTIDDKSNEMQEKRSVHHCPSCQRMIGGNEFYPSIEPLAGFVAEEKTKSVPLTRQERSFNTPVYYIGDGYPVKHAEVIIDRGKKVVIDAAHDDTLLIQSREPFYVCDECGYAVSADESNPFDKVPSEITKLIKAGAGSIHVPMFKHKTRLGFKCDSDTFTKYYLHHKFKTDVAKISFPDLDTSDLPTMESVMYALLNAIITTLQIERNDLNVTLLPTISKDGVISRSIVIYDRLAGGSGYSRRLAEDDGKLIRRILVIAYNNMMNCTCDPSCYKCLRSYDNRAIHDDLDRFKAQAFLAKVIGIE